MNKRKQIQAIQASLDAIRELTTTLNQGYEREVEAAIVEHADIIRQISTEIVEELAEATELVPKPKTDKRVLIEMFRRAAIPANAHREPLEPEIDSIRGVKDDASLLFFEKDSGLAWFMFDEDGNLINVEFGHDAAC